MVQLIPSYCGETNPAQKGGGTKGVHIPVIASIYDPVLNELEALGIKMTEEFGLPVSENIQ